MKLVSSFVFLLILSLIHCITLNNNNLNIIPNVKPSSVKLSKNSQIGLQRIKSRVDLLNKDTSCKVAAKFALLILSNVKSKSDLKQIQLGKSIDDTLKKMKAKVLQGYVLQVEIKTNHHFILFKKNGKDLYLIQAFYSYYRLKDWLSNKTLMKPYLTIDDFFTKFRTLLDANTPRDQIDAIALELFLPEALVNDNEKRTKMLKYFKGKVTLVHVDYAPFNFSITNTGNEFKRIFGEVSKSFLI